MVNAGMANSNGENKRKAPQLFIDTLNTGSLSLTYIDKMGAASTIEKLALDVSGLNVDNNNVSWIDALAEGAKLRTGAGNTNINAGVWYGSFPGTFSLEDVKFWPKVNSVLGVTLEVPRAEIKNQINSLNIFKETIQEITVYNPKFRWTLTSSGEKKSEEKGVPKLFIPKLTVIDPDMDGFRITKENKERHLVVNKGLISVKDLDLFYSNPEAIQINALSFNFPTPKVEVSDDWTVSPASVRFAGRNIIWKRGELPSGFADSVVVEGIGHVPLFKDSVHRLEVGVAGISQWNFPSPVDSFILKLANGPDWWINGADYRYKNDKVQFNVYNASVRRENRMIAFDSLLFKPLSNRENYWQSLPFQKDFISLKLGHSVVHDFLPLSNNLNGIKIKRMDVRDMEFLAARDKRMPEDTVSYRPLLAGQIQSVPIDLNIDSLFVHNGSVLYQEISPKSGLEGSLSLTNINGGMYNVFSRPKYGRDSLLLQLKGNLFNVAPIHLHYAQPYFDTLQSFKFDVQFGKWQMSSANSLLAPLNSIVFKRGLSDSLRLEAWGNSEFAYGWMGHEYRRLKIGLLRDGYKRSYFMSGPTNLLANLVMVNNNKGNLSPFFVDRMQNKATFNYWGRILREGMMGNMGMPGKKKNARKAMRKENIPAQRPVP
jgi:hypothetical protein